MTAFLFREDAFLREAEATVVAVTPDGIVLDQTPFYPQGGGQPGDAGHLVTGTGARIPITTTRYGGDRFTCWIKKFQCLI